MLKVLGDIAEKKSYWSGLIILITGLELVALYYQYVLDEWPCVLCIHVRLWLALLLLVAIIAILANRFKKLIFSLHIIVTMTALALLERSWVLLGVERGTIFGSCDMDLGLPGWLALDKWMPFIFEVKTACGYTPVVFLNITMAEALLVISALMLIVASTLTVAMFVRIRQQAQA